MPPACYASCPARPPAEKLTCAAPLTYAVPYAASLQLKLTLPEASYDVSPLAHAIDPEGSTYRVSKVKVELVLRKRETGLKWNRLIGEEAEGKTSRRSLDLT